MRSLLVGSLVSLLCNSVSAQAAWTLLYPNVSPPRRYMAQMAPLDSNGSVYVLGGWGPQQMIQDFWRLQGNSWSQVTGALPPARYSAAMVQDSVRGRLVLFGGLTANQVVLGDMWEYDGNTWGQRSSQGPSARRDHAMAYDPERQVCVLFGGHGVQLLQDTWEWNGTTWTLRQPVTLPYARAEARMVFDPSTRRILMHGGITVLPGLSLVLDDTWLWDGVNWQQATPPMVPTLRRNFVMESDLERRRVVLHGGDTQDPYVWEWDGTRWSLMVQASPVSTEWGCMAYDRIGRRMVRFGGLINVPTNTYISQSTWEYRTAAPATAVPFGSGCASSVGVPALANAPYTYPWLGDTYRSELRNLPAATSPVIFFSGFTQVGPIDLGPLGMPGCQQWVDLTFSQPAVAANSVATWTVAVPNVTALAGLHLFQQGAVLAPGTNTLGAVVSNALDLTAGIR